MNAPLPNLQTETELQPSIATVTPAMRKLIAEAIDNLLLFLDELDGDPDIEPTMAGDAFVHETRWGGSGSLDECEPSEDAEPDEDGEPWLASPENHPNGPSEPMFSRSDRGSQTSWARGSSGDGEEDDDGEPDDSGFGDMDGMLEEAETSGEPSLGWTAAINQAGRNWHGTSKLPWSAVDGEEGDDNGIGDRDGLNGDKEPDDHGIADEGGAWELAQEMANQRGYELDRERRGRVYMGEVVDEGFRPFGKPADADRTISGPDG